jgi:hypothetical protein
MRQVRRGEDHSHVFSGQKSLHRQSSVRRRTVMVKQPVLVPPSSGTFSADLLPQTLQNLQVVMLVHWSGGTNVWWTMPSQSKKRSPTCSWCSTEAPPRLNRKNYSEVCVPTWHCYRKLFWAFHAFPMHLPEFEAKFHANALFFKSAISLIIENRGSHLTRTTINTRWEATQSVMAAKLTRLTHKITIQLHVIAGNCTICSSRSGRLVGKLLYTPSYNVKSDYKRCERFLPINLCNRSHHL